MNSIRRPTAIALAALALYVTACKESTSPGAADPTGMATAITNLNTVLSQNAVFQSLAALGGAGVLGAPAAVPALVPGVRGASPSAARSFMLRLAAKASGPERAIFPSNVLGKTFQWDSAAGGYRITDSTLTGAPANGVRFKLYAVDPQTLKPTFPLTTTGTLDLGDVSNASSDGLHLVLHAGSQTAADYTVTAVTSSTSQVTTLTLTAVGFVQDVLSFGPRVTFDLSHVLTLPDSTLVTDYQASGDGATVTMQTTYSAATQSETFDWLLQKNGSVALVGINTPDSTNVVFKFNGATFATVRQQAGASPTFTGPNGGALTSSQMLALLAIAQGFGEIYVNLTLVFVPALLFVG